MEILLDRKWKRETYTIGALSVDGVRFCDTCEDKDRGLRQTDSLASIKARKVWGETAIPTGRYRVTLAVVSPKYDGFKFYHELCGGRMPRLLNVPGFDGILIHPGNTALDSCGCLLPGRNTLKGAVTESRETWTALYKKMREADARGEEIWITIK